MENNRQPFRRHHHNGVATVAFVLIAVGVILLCTNTGLIPAEYKRIFISWQMLLIVIGVVNFFKEHYFGGLALIIVGGFFLMPVINSIDPHFFSFIPKDFVQLYWPVFLIIFGAFLFLRWLFPSSKSCGLHEHVRQHHEGFHRHETIANNYVNINNMFSGSEQIVLDPEFKGGEINSIFGGAKLDLRKTNLPEGVTTLEVNMMFGGVEILVPPDWSIVVNVDTILGGFEDKRYGVQQVDTSRKLLIKGSCIFGGGELKN